MKNRMKDIVRFIDGTADEHMGAFAAQSAFFIFLSFFPIVNIFITLPQYLPITEQQLLSVIYFVMPGKFKTYITSIVSEMYNYSSGSMAIVSIIIAIWSAAKGIMAIRNGLNEVYRSRESRNYLIIRGISSIYTIVFVLFLIILIPINIFGTQIARFVLAKFPEYANETWLILSVKGTATFILLFVMFELLYTIVPTRKMKFRNQVPGALFAAFSWVAVTKLFSIYIDAYASQAYLYGSLTTVVLILFWMYFVIYLIFVGAQINEYLHVCRKREREYELSKYANGKTEVWDDDELVDTDELKGETTADDKEKLAERGKDSSG